MEKVAESGEQQVRRLTPTEYERLQGFPDGWTILERQPARSSRRASAATRTPTTSSPSVLDPTPQHLALESLHSSLGTEPANFQSPTPGYP